VSLRRATELRTLCEVLREINDLHQGDKKHDRKVRKKLIEAEYMAKKMSYKLLEYNKEYDKDWWETVEGKKREKLLKKRFSKSYLIG
jgi:hypothetical protein